MFLTNISSVLGYCFRWSYVKVCCGFCNYRKKKKEAQKKEAENLKDQQERIGDVENIEDRHNEQANTARVVDDHDDMENEINDKDEIENVSVPLTITMMIIALYIFIGACIFNSFEGWEMVTAAYFCFVTLTTIGICFILIKCKK
jgi:hypothetical protein